MKTKKTLIGLIAVLCVLSLAACSTGGSHTNNKTDTQNPIRQNPNAVQGNDSLPKDSNNSNDANSLLANSSIKGSVIEFSNDNCTITPVRESEDGNGKLAIEDAPGHAKELTEKWVAVPSTSEHQLGLGVDINADGVHSYGNEVYSWLWQSGLYCSGKT